jgi:hypothetical protein
VHPNEIKTLAPGEIVMITSLPSTRIDRLNVTPSPTPVRSSPVPAQRSSSAQPILAPGSPRPPRPERGSPGRRPPPDQAAPGVTR